MTESFNRKAGEYVLNFFKIYKLDEPEDFINISALVHYFELVESMDNGYIHGHAKIYDSTGLLDEFLGEDNGWLKGEEEIEITYTDFFKEKIKQKFFVYAITDVAISKDSDETIYEYKIHFVSKNKFFGDRDEVRKSFRDGLISDYAQSIFDEYFTDSDKKEIKIEPTDGNQNLVVPNYTPEETMHFFSRKAVSPKYSAHNFRFFESKDRYYFGTQGYIFEEKDFEIRSSDEDFPIFTRQNISDQSPAGQRRLMSTLISIEYPNYVNTIQDIKEGAYYSNTTELDILNRTELFNEYRYLDEYQNNVYPDGQNNVRSKHSKAFVDEHLSYPKNNLVIKDYSDVGQKGDSEYLRPHTFYPKLYNEKNVAHYHHHNEAIEIQIYGRTKMTVGDIIQLQLKEVIQTTEDRNPDNKRSGFYLVESVRSTFFEDQFIQSLTVSKSGFKGRPESADPYDNGPQTESVYTESGQTPGAGNVSEPSSLVGTPTRVSGSVSNREQQAMQFYVNKGYTPEQAAGIVANLTNESAMNPNAVNPNDAGPGLDSEGLAQWNRERLSGLQDFAGDNNPYDFETQLAYVDFELNNNERAAGSQLQNATNARDAALAITRYERFAGYEQGRSNREVQNRMADAERILQTYRGN